MLEKIIERTVERQELVKEMDRRGIHDIPAEIGMNYLGGKRKTKKSTNKKKNKKTRSKKQKGGNRDYALYVAARQGSVDIVINMLEQGADINWTKNDGTTPLFIASQEGHVDVVSVLLKQGADINKASQGKTPLQIARQRNHTEIVHLLELAAQVRPSSPSQVR